MMQIQGFFVLPQTFTTTKSQAHNLFISWTGGISQQFIGNKELMLAFFEYDARS
jgi:hypothetical protein